MAGDRRINGRLLARLIGDGAQGRPYYLAMARAIGSLVLDGRVPTYTRLPAERDLAEALGVSRTTVSAAYTWLREQGYLDSRQGAGSWTVLPGTGAEAAAEPGAPASAGTGAGGLSGFGGASPPAVEGLQAAARLAVEQLAAHVGRPGYSPHGLPELRHAIARRYVERGLATTPEQILVTNGAQHAFTLLTALLLEPGDALLMESPGSPHALECARAAGLRIHTAGVAGDGWDPGPARGALRRTRPRAALFTPDFQNPTGALMDDDERAALAAEARAAGTLLIVDESAAELAIDSGDQPAPAAVHDTDGRVFSVGSASKLLWGGLRVGWVRTTPPMVERLAAVRRRTDLGGGLIDQLTVTRLLADVTRIRAERSTALRRGRDALVAALRARLPEWRFTTPSGGPVLWAALPEPVAGRLAEAALRHGADVAPGPAFGDAPPLEHHVRIAYTRPAEDYRALVGRLADAYAEARALPAPPHGRLYL